MQCL